MTPALTLWTYSLVAILFTTLALDRWRRNGASPLVAALALTGLWALAIAGIGPRDVAAQVAEGVRDLAWIAATAALVRRAGPAGTLGARWIAVTVVAVVLSVSLMLLAVAHAGPDVAASVAVGRSLRVLIALSGLVLLLGAARGRSGQRLAAAIAMLWGVDLFVTPMAFVIGASPALPLIRGAAVIGAGAAFALAAQPRTDRTFEVSRKLSMRALAAAAFLVYAAIVVAATGLAASFGGTHVRIIQTAIVSGAAATLLALVSTPWLRAWTRVVVEKNLFGHRYDYRSAWLRFTDTLGRPGEGAPLGGRIVQATADLLDAPAGLLLVRDGDDLHPAAGWRWDGEADRSAGPALCALLDGSGRVVELDRVRDASAPGDDAAAVPAWMLADRQAWAIAPLVHMGTLLGAILLSRPPVSRALDWEDFDLLRLAGRQAASYLAEDRAHAALADAERFDEFNRRFAFILHDIKNLVSQVGLVARNAERHADNPAFRTDMVATLRDSTDRMNALIARLSHRAPPRVQPVGPIDLRAVAERSAARRRSQHPIEVAADRGIVALADSTGLAQALDHLVQNAVEASPAGVPVRLTVRGEAARAVIEVADRGVGMTPAFVRDRLFRPFASSKPDGFGLGAFEAREIVRAMGGTLDVDSREGEGTRFRITLPAAASLDQAA